MAMQQRLRQFEASLTPVLATAGYELLLAEHEPKTNVVRLYIDHAEPAADAAVAPDGPQRSVGFDDCAKVSSIVSDLVEANHALDDFGDFALEVSSPGVERPLTRLAHYVRFVGHAVAITTRSNGKRQKLFGTLEAADETSLTLRRAPIAPRRGAKAQAQTPQPDAVQLALVDIERAHLAYEPSALQPRAQRISP